MNKDTVENKTLTVKEPEIFSLKPKNLTEALEFAKIISDSDLTPKDFKGKIGNILIAMQWAHELGIPLMQGLQGIAVVNGRPSIWGDLGVALMQHHPAYEWHDIDSKPESVTVTVKRRGANPHSVTWDKARAVKAGLWNDTSKVYTWGKFSQDMLYWRAMTRAIRDKFADALKGLSIVEETKDYHDLENAKELPQIEMPTRASEAKALPEPAPNQEAEPTNGNPVTESGQSEKMNLACQRALWNLAKKKGMTEEDMKNYMKVAHNVESFKDLPQDAFEPIKNWLDAQGGQLPLK
jgi:hypothetical protein